MQRKGCLRPPDGGRARLCGDSPTRDGGFARRRAARQARRRRILDALPTKQRDQFIDDLLSIIGTLQKLSAGQKA
jgi:hypothetical protein